MQRTIENNLLRLTPAEKHVMELVSRGWDNGTIAQYLYISVRTLNYHLGSIYSKLSCIYDFEGKDKRAYLCAIWREWNAK